MLEVWICPNTGHRHIFDAQENAPRYCGSCGQQHKISYYVKNKGKDYYEKNGYWYQQQFLEPPADERRNS
jgi:hypothetical protein